MLAIFYLFFSFLLGLLVINAFLPKMKILTRLAASFLIGIFLITWLTFLFSLLFSFTTDPLQWGIRVSFLILLVIGLVLKKSRPKLTMPAVQFFFLALVLLVSGWLMRKSFGYTHSHFLIASNIYDDFNIHLGVMRSFSWGENFPAQLPFFAGGSIRYHFMTDFLFGVLEFLGLNPGWAINLPCFLAFASLLIFIFALSQKLVGGRFWLGLFSAILSLFNSSLTFVKFFQRLPLSWQTPKQVWRLGRYLSAGPFDGGIISIFWNLNTFLNQRHLIFSSAMFLLVIDLLLIAKENKRSALIFLAGFLTGFLPAWHGLVFLATFLTGLYLSRRQWLLFLWPALILGLPQVFWLSGQVSRLPQWRPGFLVSENLSLVNIGRYWIQNLGLSLFLVPWGLWLAGKNRRLLLPIGLLFGLPNLFQFTANIFHNHSFLNLGIILANFYSALVLSRLWQKNWSSKILALALLFFLTFSGVFDLMVIKNDFIHQIADYPQDELIAWIKEETSPQAVFMSPDQPYQAPTLAGRKVFLSTSHFVWGYGYQVEPRKILTNKVYDSDNEEEVRKLLKQAEVDYWLTNTRVQFNFAKVYEDEKQIVYQVAQN